jgi:large subunit ribosomal protein L21
MCDQAAREDRRNQKMYAIVRVSGKQYRAEEGRTIVVDKMTKEVGDQIDLDQVLLISDGDATQVGQPTISGAVVSAEVVSQFKGKKIIVFKYKPKIRYRRKQGHRQQYTRLLVNSISASGTPKAAPKKSKASKKAEASESE